MMGLYVIKVLEMWCDYEVLPCYIPDGMECSGVGEIVAATWRAFGVPLEAVNQILRSINKIYSQTTLQFMSWLEVMS